MVDVTILGGGRLASSCADVLGRAGFQLRRTFEVDNDDRSPVILGDVTGAFMMARQIVESGRHVLIASPAALSPERLSQLLQNRKRAQAIFVWSERRFHPGYRFISSLVETDATWRPRFLRQETLSLEPTTGVHARWLVLESLGLILSLTGQGAKAVIATSAVNTTRNAPDLVSLALSFDGLEAFVQVGLGEAIERRETLLVAEGRKAYVDELNQSVPLRLIEDDRHASLGSSARWLSCASPTPDELARQQCLAFLDATLKSQLALEEAQLWLRSLAALSAAERSLMQGASVRIEVPDAEPRFRLIPNGPPLRARPHPTA